MQFLSFLESVTLNSFEDLLLYSLCSLLCVSVISLDYVLTMPLPLAVSIPSPDCGYLLPWISCCFHCFMVTLQGLSFSAPVSIGWQALLHYGIVSSAQMPNFAQ